MWLLSRLFLALRMFLSAKIFKQGAIRAQYVAVSRTQVDLEKRLIASARYLHQLFQSNSADTSEQQAAVAQIAKCLNLVIECSTPAQLATLHKLYFNSRFETFDHFDSSLIIPSGDHLVILVCSHTEQQMQISPLMPIPGLQIDDLDRTWSGNNAYD